jgi:hypothetical protein
MWTVALEYGDPDHCWWMSPGEARALAEALLAAAEWTPVAPLAEGGAR